MESRNHLKKRGGSEKPKSRTNLIYITYEQ